MAHSDLAVQARTSVDCARVGVLTTYARPPGSRHTCSVSVRARADGSVDVETAIDAESARQLTARPVASLVVAPAGCEPALLHGSARRLPRDPERGTLVFHLELTAVRVGHPAVRVQDAAYRAAAPDPLRHDAPAVLAHLNDGHGDALAACLRAGGHDAAIAHASRLDADGLTVTAIGGSGVDVVRLAFPRSVACLTDLPAGLRFLLGPLCACGHISDGPRAVREERR